MKFDEFFRKATGDEPFPFQRRFAEAQGLPQLVHVPTGLGKTAMVVVGWLWRRFAAEGERKSTTPRRLVYCLPMRVLVEQTRDNAILWLHNLCLFAGKAEFDDQNGSKRLRCYTPDLDDPRKVAVHILMGGEDEEDWDIHPERDAIIIGTQDMLLSRALNRGYAASRARWPMQFGLLHTDCLWVFDEIQLMGSGLATTAQLEAFRHMLGSKDSHGCHSVWMSATMQRDWLKTVDFKDRVNGLHLLGLDDDDHRNGVIQQRWKAKKPLVKATAKMGKAAALAEEIRQAHKPGTRTIVIVNTVKRACELHDALNHASIQAPASTKKNSRKKRASAAMESDPPDASKPRIVLLHSRFRPCDRKARLAEAMADPPGGGTIIVSTQVIEAGVDVSATTLLTELAPWASLVQRFGRCNRRGEENERASVRWIDVPDKNAAPYDAEDMKQARELLETIGEKSETQPSVSLGPLIELNVELPFNHTHVIRRKDLIDLFDTTPDLAGNDIDIDRFVREVEDSDVRVFWRAWNRPKGHESLPDDEPAPRREELCLAPVGEFKKFAADEKRKDSVWRWNFLDGTWEKVSVEKIAPGQVFLVHADAGGYSAERGWDPVSQVRVEPLALAAGTTSETPDATDDDRLSRVGGQTIASHTDEVCRELDTITKALPLDDAQRAALRTAARWHDAGKRHGVFQGSLPDGIPDATKAWAKAAGQWKQYERPHFRHELASALAVLLAPEDLIPKDQRDLVAYLVAAHHGKVRLSIRSLPNELRPRDGNGRPVPQKRFARGVWDGDTLPATDLGGGITAPGVTLSLEPMELGLGERPPFAGQPSWADRMIRLRDALGPFRLAYLEAILRAADWRASKAAQQRAAVRGQGGAGTETKEAGHG